MLVGRLTADTLLTDVRVLYIQISHCSNERGNEGVVFVGVGVVVGWGVSVCLVSINSRRPDRHAACEESICDPRSLG